MRRFMILPAFLLILSCGPSQLSRSEAEKDIRQDYPVVVDIQVPQSANATQGSPELAKLAMLQEQLAKTGWFTIERKLEGSRERITYQRSAGAPNFIRTTAKGFTIPAAQAEFVKALRFERAGEGLKVAYQIKLTKPTAQFPIFQALHPDVKIGDTKERHALYKREGRSWVLQETDEFFKKAE